MRSVLLFPTILAMTVALSCPASAQIGQKKPPGLLSQNLYNRPDGQARPQQNGMLQKKSGKIGIDQSKPDIKKPDLLSGMSAYDKEPEEKKPEPAASDAPSKDAKDKAEEKPDEDNDENAKEDGEEGDDDNNKKRKIK